MDILPLKNALFMGQPIIQLDEEDEEDEELEEIPSIHTENSN